MKTGWKLYDYLDQRGANDISRWSKSLQKSDLARLNRKLQMLQATGPELGPNLLAGPIVGHAHIYKLRINGRVAIRLLLCKGPIDNEREFTLLVGAFEVDGKWQPRDAPTQAETRRDHVRNDPTRRCDHVKVT